MNAAATTDFVARIQPPHPPTSSSFPVSLLPAPSPSPSSRHFPLHSARTQAYINEKEQLPSAGALSRGASPVATPLPSSYRSPRYMFPSSPAVSSFYSQRHPPISPHPLTSLSPFPTLPSFASYNRTAQTPAYTRSRGLRTANLIKPWTPIILYAITTLAFIAAITFWKTEVFTSLDLLAHWLQSDLYLGYAVISFLIFLTTFPPVPLYSTLVILSGYTFGPWVGFIISYIASLVGALTVFILSRALCRAQISQWLSYNTTVKRIVRAIEKRPKLLFLIRLAPYPYNVMNCLLAASPTLTLRTFTFCTALSLPKLIIHTSIGSTIHSFALYHTKVPGAAPEGHSELGRYSTFVGIALCVAIFAYLAYVARRAVDDELDDDVVPRNSEETAAFLADGEDDDMVEASFHQVGSRPSSPRHADTMGERFARMGDEEARIGL